MSQVKTGTVISNKMPKTVVVKVLVKTKHPLYKKMITKTKNFNAYNDRQLAIGQKVKIIETRPLAKQVHFKILEVLD
ncbi:30S ribosomal protein S17 [Candidatus Curtissbacteria bacterium RIFCSPHIGHO2_12_FULL_41_17]|uniref:Small ribosomal subunit protein uS17 n=1 Tax=Candidatus Curtissbacteria bacterium RIFCSPHIGHO2_12_FULL_41_17 TaxID=1797722 RepID=A0A1F5HMF6_9BACT|nr:MAG: 30S ribosomal protein S17 [Candidatus Curtissbacteria bacterium RIFCSPHIGHO2_12_FULL_41_17]